jgi:hypothetical protein
MAINLRSTKGIHANGVKLLVYANAGSGKTRLITTLPNPVVFSAEGGLLSIADADVPFVEVSSYDTLMEAYQWVIGSDEAKHFESIALDSISEIAEVVLNHEKKIAKDPRQAYGEVITLMEKVIRDFRDMPGKNVYFVAKEESVKDELTGASKLGPSMPGAKLGAKIPYFFDEVFHLGMAKDNNGVSYRFLRTQPDIQFVAKDRSGALAPAEFPHLGQVISKILAS